MGLEGRELEKAKRLRAEGASYRSIARILNRPLSVVYESLKDVEVEADIEDGVLEIVDGKFNSLVDALSDFIRDVFLWLGYLTYMVKNKDPTTAESDEKLKTFIDTYLKRLDKLKGVGRR